MGRNIFAPPSTGEQAAAPAGQGSSPPQKKGRNIFQAPQYDDYKAPPELDLSGYSKDELLAAYKNLPRDDPRRAQVKAKLVNDSSEYFNREVMAPWASYAAGTMEGASLGWSDEVNAGLTGLTGGLYSPLGGKTYEEELQLQRAQLKNAEKDNPGPYFAGQLTGGAIQAVPTLGMSIPESMGMRLISNVAGGAAQGAAYSAGEDDGDLESRLGAGASGALWGAGFGAIPTAGEAIWKGGKAIASKTAQGVRKVTNPFLAAENDIVDRGVRDRVAQFTNEQQPNPPQRRFLTQDDVDAAMARGDDVMVSDLLGDGGRRRLKAAANVSEDASNLMRGAADGRQQVQSQTFMDTLSDMTGDNDPATIVERLKQMARDENDAAYGLVENHPNASSMWNTQLQRAISTPEGREALKAALANSRRDAINKGQSIFEPVFEEGPDGLMQWTGRLRRPTGEMADDVQGMGVGFRFWDSVKKSFDDQITALYKGGYKEEAKAVRATRDQMVASLDSMLTDGSGNSLYARARGTAKEFFDAEDAHEAGMKYFERMGAFKTSEVRRELGKMSPSERELFARGYAASLMHNVSSLGRGEEVSKLFRSVESRRKMVDALGPGLANQIEAITHVRMVQGLLGRELQSGSSTVLQNIAQEGMKYTAATTAGGGLGYYQTNDYTGLFAGMAIGGGFRFTQRRVVERYARALAEVARSNDPAVIARISKRIAEDPRLLEFTRAAANGAQRASAASSRVSGGAGAAQQGVPEINIPGGDLPTGNEWGGGRVEPRMPFAGGGLVKEAVEAIGKIGRSTVKNPVRKAFPGIYKEPGALLDDVRVEPEDPALKQLFGVTRDDLFEMSKRKGNVDDVLGLKGKVSRGSEATDNVKTPRNAKRLVSALEAARGNEGLWKGMHGWYTMDPAYQYLVREYGPEEAAKMFTKFNTLTGMSSPGSEVVTELQRGSAANMMDNLGRFDEFLQKGGLGKELRAKVDDFPEELAAVDGHPYHSTSQAPAMEKYLRTGKVEMGSAKVPTYIASSTPPELGNFTDLPVADAHFTRAIGLPDTRTAEKVFDHSMTMGEYKAVAPWFRDEVANASDLESVPAQAILWGLYGPQTGVTTAVGAPKLELLAKGIMETARRLGVSPEVARDLVLTGKAHAYEQGGLVSALEAAHC